MKRYTILGIWFLFLAGTLFSCYDDKGNYDYDWVPEVVLEAGNSGLGDLVVKRGQRLTIKPNLKLLTGAEGTEKDTAEFRPEDYTYRWVAYQRVLAAGSVELATTQNLDTIIDLPLLTEPYRIQYTVRGKETGVDYSFSFNLRVETRYENAWLFLTENNEGIADLTLYGKEVGNTSENPWVYEHHVLERSGFPYRGGGAKFVYYNSFNNKNYLMVGTGEGSGWLGKNDLDWTETQMLRYLMAMPKGLDYTFEKVIKNGTGVWFFVGSDGSIYAMGNSVIMLDACNNLSPSVTGTGQYQKVKMTPFAGGDAMQSFLYDESNEVMLLFTGTTANLSGNPIYALPENLKLRNHKLFLMESYGLSLTNVYAKNKADNKYYRYTYDTYDRSETKLGEPFEITNGELLEQGEQFVCDYMNGFFYMSMGNKLYVLRGPELREVTIKDPDGVVTGGFQGLESISLLTRYTGIPSTTPYIMAATYGGTENSGKVYFLELNSIESSELTVRAYFEGLEKVKSISRF